VCTVVLGMLLAPGGRPRNGTALSFVVVATSVLTVLLLGWRLVAPSSTDPRGQATWRDHLCHQGVGGRVGRVRHREE
jgi:hypothetical protein